MKKAKKTKKTKIVESLSAMGGAAPPTITNDPDDTVVRGQQAWKRLKETGRTSWEDWKLVGFALKEGRVQVMEATETRKPNGKRYSEAFSIWLQAHDFDAIEDSDRAKLLSLMENLDRVEKWLDTKTEAERVQMESSLDRLADFALPGSRPQRGQPEG